ncbi:MAG: pre-peptidase C-terminal domain-containing protein, partial [Bacteroidales bacterium]|nr:pre-peptidase C-terminal domain-containing protein [Bacteroidales bacterium]
MKNFTYLLIMLSLWGWQNSAQAQISLADLLASPTDVIANPGGLPFTHNGAFGPGGVSPLVAGEDGKFRNSGENYYANAYQITLAAGDRIQILHDAVPDAFLYLFNAAGTRMAFDDDEGRNHGGGWRASYIDFTASTAGAYLIVATTYDPNSTGSYTLSVSALIEITAITAAPASIEVPFDEYPQDELYRQVTLTGSYAGGTVTFQSDNWSLNEISRKYVYYPQNSDLPFGFAFAAMDDEDLPQVTVTRPAFAVDKIITLPHSEQLQLTDNTVVWQFTLSEDAVVSFAAAGLAAGESLHFTLLDQNKDPFGDGSFDDAFNRDRGPLQAGTWYVMLRNDHPLASLSVEFSVQLSPSVVYTALAYTPMTVGTPVNGSFNQNSTTVLNPDLPVIGAGYSFAATKDKHYRITYTLNSSTNTYLDAALFLLTGGELQGDKNNWNGDFLYGVSDYANGTSLTVSFTYTANATGNLRLLPIAYFGSDEVSYTLSVTELPIVVYTALDYTPMTVGTPVNGSFNQNSTTVLNPGWSDIGAGYSFAATAGERYQITYTLYSSTNTDLGAGLFLLTGGELQGDQNNWNGDYLSHSTSSVY